LFSIAAAAQQSYDILIKNGRIVDGAGNPWYQADIAIRGGKIAAIGKLTGPAQKTINATGLYVTPGFIDMLGQSEFALLVDPQGRSKIAQGITSEITGEGGSIAPLNDALVALDKPMFDHFHVAEDWRTFREYFARLDRSGIGINLGSYVGATQVRAYVLHDENRAPTAAELEKMKSLVADAMRDGAMGLSTALAYAPASYAKTDEVIELAKVAASFGGLYATHMRTEGARIIDAIDEAIRIGREASIPVEIFHLKVAGKDNWGRMPEVLRHIEAARAGGIDITADQYPYIAGATSLDASLPRWAAEGGRAAELARLRDPASRARVKADISAGAKEYENFYALAGGAQGVMIAGVLNPKLARLQGKRLSEIAAERRADPIDTLMDIIVEDQAQTGAIYFIMSEDDVRAAVSKPWISIGLDAPIARTTGPLAEQRPHPRAYGSAARWLAVYVRDQKLMSLEDAIRKLTSLAAQRVGLGDRGVLRPGMAADIAIFDLAKVHDTATFENPAQYAEGFRYVLVNGRLALDDGKFTGATDGKVLRGPGYRP
jgi:dihydroorotase/N-acyl-D-amino-acid deacylase